VEARDAVAVIRVYSICCDFDNFVVPLHLSNPNHLLSLLVLEPLDLGGLYLDAAILFGIY